MGPGSSGVAMADNSVDAPDWSNIPAPADDGAASHLFGIALPSIPLWTTTGGQVDLAALEGRTVVYAYPRTGQPGMENPDGWDMIAGARGCSPQSCAFRDHFAELRQLGVGQLYGLSTQDTVYQSEVVQRLHLPFAILSDEHLALTKALDLPTFEAGGMTLLKRVTLVIDDGVVTHIFYPVFPPDQSTAAVIVWLSANRDQLQSQTAGP